MNTKAEFHTLILQYLQKLKIDEAVLIPEFHFHQTRDWRFDYAIPELNLAFEYEGIFAAKKGHSAWASGKSGKSRHLTITGYSNDCEKYTWANILGWTLVRITPKMISDGRAGPLIRQAIDTALNPDRRALFSRKGGKHPKKT